jgi:hypothetical protein
MQNMNTICYICLFVKVVFCPKISWLQKIETNFFKCCVLCTKSSPWFLRVQNFSKFGLICEIIFYCQYLLLKNIRTFSWTLLTIKHFMGEFYDATWLNVHMFNSTKQAEILKYHNIKVLQ